MAKPLLEVRNVYKSFGKRRVLKGVSFKVYPGEVYALIGPNGAGKTTTLRIITGIYKPERGEVIVCGKPLSDETRRCMAYLPENAGIYPRLTGIEHLKLLIGLYTGSKEETEKSLAKAVEYSRLGKDLYRRASEYSKGMRRRLQLAAILSVNTPILVLDEPTSGLDVHSSVETRRIIVKAALNGKAVLMTSHNMLEVERIAHRVGFLYNGTIIAEGKPGELMARYDASDLEEAFVKATSLEAG